MRDTCRRCNKRFTPTSWTTSNFWRSVCPPCIISILERMLEIDKIEAEKLGKVVR